MNPRALTLAAGALWLGCASPALACGGLFCGRVPVDQTGEKILFAADGKEVTAHVQIQYKGDAKHFSWILPVPTAPRLSVGSDTLFAALRTATKPSFQLAIRDEGPCTGMPVFKSGIAPAPSRASAPGGGVTVVSQEQVGPYDTAVLQANDAGVLKAWLRRNDYVIPPKLDPLLDPYVAGKYAFVALKLTKDRAVGDIQPIVMTYKATKPGIPIRLTGVAATPDMDVFCWVLGAQRAVPENYRHAVINEARIDWVNGGANYKAVVTRAVDEAGGQAFVTDYAGPSDVVGADRFSRAHFKLDALAATHDPVRFAQAVIAGGFFGEQYASLNQEALVAFLKKHIRKPRSLKATDDATFYRYLNEHAEALHEAGVTVDTTKAIAELEAKVVKPSEQIGKLFARYPYLTALYTTMSPPEMTQDPTFRFNPRLARVAAVHHADGVRRCKKDLAYWKTPIEITLGDGRKLVAPGGGGFFFRGRPISSLEESTQPAAIAIEQLNPTGEPVRIQDNRAASEALLAEAARPAPEARDGRPWAAGGLTLGLLALLGLRRRRR